MKRGRKWAAALAVWLCLCLSGCSFAPFNAKNLMAPPKANADQQAIHRLLQGSMNDITFIYPKNGEYRSAIIMADFTGDGKEDALGFYSLGDAGGVEVQFLEKTEGEWRTAASFKNNAIQVDRVCFGDLTGDGVEDVLIGWGSVAGTTGRTAAVNAYVYSEGTMTESPLGTYGEMVLTDLDDDGVSEVFTVEQYLSAEEEGDEPYPARAKVYVWQNGAMEEKYSADASNSISNFSSIIFGRLNSSQQGVVLDGAKADGNLITQIFYLEKEKLINAPSGTAPEGNEELFLRPPAAPVLCRDINSDGIIEIPTVSTLPGISEDVVPDVTSFLIEWGVYQQENGRRPIFKCLMNPQENYWFYLPPFLNGKITASNDPGRRTVTYAQVMEPEEDGSQLLGSPMFSVRVFTRASWESLGQSGGYEQLAVQNDTVYGIQVLAQDERLLKQIEVIRNNFRLLSE